VVADTVYAVKAAAAPRVARRRAGLAEARAEARAEVEALRLMKRAVLRRVARENMLAAGELCGVIK
jgi:hypothetical protein